MFLSVGAGIINMTSDIAFSAVESSSRALFIVSNSQL